MELPNSPEVYPIREFLKRSVMDFEWIDISDDNSGTIHASLFGWGVFLNIIIERKTYF